PRDYPCVHLGRFEATLSVRRPLGYIIPPGFDSISEKLHQHGIITESFEGGATIEAYTITRMETSEHEFQKHRNVQVDAKATSEVRKFPKGSTLVRTAQPLG